MPARHTSSTRRRRPGCRRAMPSSAEDLGERPGPVARLARQAEVLEPMSPHRQRRRARHPVALVADEDGRLAVRADDQQRLLEARVESGQVRQVRAVLAVGVDDEPVVARAHRRARAGARAARAYSLRRDLRHRGRACRSRAASTSARRGAAGSLVSTTVGRPGLDRAPPRGRRRRTVRPRPAATDRPRRPAT